MLKMNVLNLQKMRDVFPGLVKKLSSLDLFLKPYSYAVAEKIATLT